MCYSNQFLWERDNQCHECPIAGCSSCSLGECKSCGPGLMLDMKGNCITEHKNQCGYGKTVNSKGGCDKCHELCLDCFGEGADHCITCRRFYQNDTIIIRNHTSCLLVTSDSIKLGLDCGPGRGLGVDGVCDVCPPNCQTCVPDPEVEIIPNQPTVFKCLPSLNETLSSEETNEKSDQTSTQIPTSLIVFVIVFGVLAIVLIGLRIANYINSRKRIKRARYRMAAYHHNNINYLPPFNK